MCVQKLVCLMASRFGEVFFIEQLKIRVFMTLAERRLFVLAVKSPFEHVPEQ